ncbi:MAG: DUF427 domain-containing protein [Pseudomonadota bacterium]
MLNGLPEENVQDYPRPPRLEPVELALRVALGGQEIARTTRGWRVLETHHAPTYYLPEADVDMTHLRPIPGGSLCEWKGRAAYFDLVTEGMRIPRAAWCYPEPTRAFGSIRSHLAFYAGPLDCFVGEVPVTAQPGDFYGGWVTPNLKGIVKGAPGTRHW